MAGHENGVADAEKADVGEGIERGEDFGAGFGKLGGGCPAQGPVGFVAAVFVKVGEKRGTDFVFAGMGGVGGGAFDGACEDVAGFAGVAD